MRKIITLNIYLILTFVLLVKSTLASSAILNEFMSHPSSGSDWIEVYNPTNSNIDLSSWTLVDNTSTMKTLSGSISASGFTTFDVSNRLNNGGDSIYLKDPSGNIIDNYSYGSDPGVDKSVGRNPDGGNWTTLANNSKGSTNGNSSPVSTPSPTNTPTPQPTLIAVSSPTGSSTPQSSSFTSSNVPSQINSDQSFTASVNLSLPNNPNSSFYLKGAFKKADSSNYFGLTKVSGNWVKNSSTFSNQSPITTNSSGNWPGNLGVMVDPEDSGYIGTGDYIFKVGRYTIDGSGPTWSNEVTIHINNVESAQDSLSDDQVSTSKTIINSSPTATPVLSKSSISQSKTSTNVASVAGASKIQTPSSTSAVASSPSPNISIANQKQNNPFVFIGIIFIIGGVGSLGYIYLKKNEAVYKYFRKRN